MTWGCMTSSTRGERSLMRTRRGDAEFLEDEVDALVGVSGAGGEDVFLAVEAF